MSERQATPQPSNKVTAQDLLWRTVLYKVGHHGSYNATGREYCEFAHECLSVSQLDRECSLFLRSAPTRHRQVA